jgi:hypothetical protein
LSELLSIATSCRLGFSFDGGRDDSVQLDCDKIGDNDSRYSDSYQSLETLCSQTVKIGFAYGFFA